ncbi:hypothetical protein [Tateyamaria sp.]|uniref:hypothetical protein n=1 Tax=Tateyamaria sp. TaxID=1929288 RepID=UPI00329CF5ED
MQNILTSDQVSSTVTAIILEREVWENGVFKKSNDALYEILEKAYHLYQQIKGSRSLIKALNQQLDALKIPYNANTSLAAKIAKLIFGDCGNRVFAYATVLVEAARRNMDVTQLKAWIIEQNGIENIRKTKGKGEQRSLSELADDGAELCSAVDALFSIKKPHSDLVPHPEATNEFAVALVRPSLNGAHEVVFGTNKKSIVNTVLGEAGRKLSSTKTAEDAAAETKRRQHDVDDAVDAASATA